MGVGRNSVETNTFWRFGDEVDSEIMIIKFFDVSKRILFEFLCNISAKMVNDYTKDYIDKLKLLCPHSCFWIIKRILATD